jgi:hypothetical protein
LTALEKGEVGVWRGILVCELLLTSEESIEVPWRRIKGKNEHEKDGNDKGGCI